MNDQEGSSRGFPHVRMFFAIVVIVIAIAPMVFRYHHAQAAPVIPPDQKVWVGSTGQVVAGAFLGYWLTHPDIGNPITSAAVVGDRWTQWFEHARLEIVDAPIEAATIDNVRVVPIGRAFAATSGYIAQLDAFTPRESGLERFFPDTGHSIQNGFRAFYEQWGMPEHLGPPISEEFLVGQTAYQFFEYGVLSWTPESGVIELSLPTLDAGLNGQSTAWQPQPWDAIDVEADTLDLIELSDLMIGERWIEIDLSDFEVTAWVGDFPVLRSITSIGVPQSPTPIGEFAIYLKHDVQSLQGITWDGQPYFEPNTKWVMYFYQDFGFHSSNWRTVYGRMDSQGCVVPPMDIAEKLYFWADYGTRVVVHE